MDKLLEALGEIFKALFTVSPATAVLFLICCILIWTIRHLYGRINLAQEAAIKQHETAEEKLRKAQQEIRIEYQQKIDAKDGEIALLHERAVERDNVNTKILEGLRVSIAKGNTKPFLQSLWNGIAHLGKLQGIDIHEMRMLDHVSSQNLENLS